MKATQFRTPSKRIRHPLLIWAMATLIQPAWFGDTIAASHGFFTDAKPVAGLEGSYVDVQPDISPDGLTLHFASWNRPGVEGGSDIFRATRAHPEDPFDLPVRLEAPVNSGFRDSTPHLSQDGLTIYFSSDRPGGMGGWDLYQASRASTDLPFSNALNLGPGVNSPSRDHSPSVSADGLTMYFMSERENFGDFYVATRTNTDEPFGNVRRIGFPVSTATYEFDVAIAPNGLGLLFSRWADGRAYDLHLATRSDWLEDFTQVVDLNALSHGAAINTSCYENGATLSWDWPTLGSKMYFQRDCTADFSDIDIWEATWIPIPELSITVDGENVTLSWPDLPDPHFSLEEATDLALDNWTASPAAAGTSVTVSPSGPDKFFRLRTIR
jgi:hypothetical protein